MIGIEKEESWSHLEYHKNWPFPKRVPYLMIQVHELQSLNDVVVEEKLTFSMSEFYRERFDIA